MSLHHQINNPKPWKQSKTIPTFKVVQCPTNYQTWSQSYSIYTICNKGPTKAYLKGLSFSLSNFGLLPNMLLMIKKKSFYCSYIMTNSEKGFHKWLNNAQTTNQINM
jgi:hypothetical protein